ncbi:flagellar basal-body MS-ring/collar protein FliF [Sedimentimonas flavescens]|uniref:flagellar basal-body MS-ring/collar protein FliF n=1 Tax=Sedimentimonas flavescens TaxID=2851012 RepID=UPI001C4A1D11|nr:flagellar basal-body MS-ring/collar protein FliF [Sedimentimonas flavescens]MBW0158052.1 flagellar M-ring protein FliF [Sedimentimonas flavescens]
MLRTTGQKPTQRRCVLQQLLTVWQALDTSRRIIVGGITALVFAAVLSLSAMASKPAMALLYAGLEGAQAGEIVSALEQRGALYEVRGDSIYVEAPRRDELRMTLAAEGLPATGGAGYELLDSLSGFGTTSQMFDAAYWRAKEGELARTIVSNPAIRVARVHIAAPPAQSFRKDLHPTASVTIQTATGGLSAQHAKALRYLVASAVAGMRPEDVSVIDGAGGLIASGEEDSGAQGGEDRAAELKRNVERLLEALVGYGNAVVELSVETVTEREAITERRFDPDGRVAISTDTEERANSANDSKAGAVTVASNLPEGDAAVGGRSQSNASETRERTNYEVSETTREVLRSPGAIRRLSVAVLVDGVETLDGNGAPQWQPRPDEELEALRALVASAVGFDEARGDVITLRSMAFEPLTVAGTEAGGGLFAGGLDMMQTIQLAVLAVVVLGLGMFVLRPILMQPPREPAPGVPVLARGSAPAALTGEIADEEMQGADARPVQDVARRDLAITREPPDAVPEDPVTRLKRLIEERQTETVEILRNWMDDKEPTG